MQEHYPVPISQERATAIKDSCQVDVEDDASQRAQDAIGGDIDIETNLDTLISLPLKHVLLDSTEAFHHPSIHWQDYLVS